MALDKLQLDMLKAAEKESFLRIQEIMMVSLLMGDEDTFIYIAQHYRHCFTDAEGQKLCDDIIEEAKLLGKLNLAPDGKPLH